MKVIGAEFSDRTPLFIAIASIDGSSSVPRYFRAAPFATASSSRSRVLSARYPSHSTTQHASATQLSKHAVLFSKRQAAILSPSWTVASAVPTLQSLGIS